MLIKNEKGITINTEKIWGIQYELNNSPNLYPCWYFHKKYKTLKSMLDGMKNLERTDYPYNFIFRPVKIIYTEKGDYSVEILDELYYRMLKIKRVIDENKI